MNIPTKIGLVVSEKKIKNRKQITLLDIIGPLISFVFLRSTKTTSNI